MSLADCCSRVDLLKETRAFITIRETNPLLIYISASIETIEKSSESLIRAATYEAKGLEIQDV